VADSPPPTAASTSVGKDVSTKSDKLGKATHLPRGFSLKTLQRRMQKERKNANEMRRQADTLDPAGLGKYLASDRADVADALRADAARQQRLEDKRRIKVAEHDVESAANQHMVALLDAGNVSHSTHQGLSTAMKGATGHYTLEAGACSAGEGGEDPPKRMSCRRHENRKGAWHAAINGRRRADARRVRQSCDTQEDARAVRTRIPRALWLRVSPGSAVQATHLRAAAASGAEKGSRQATTRAEAHAGGRLYCRGRRAGKLRGGPARPFPPTFHQRFQG